MEEQPYFVMGDLAHLSSFIVEIFHVEDFGSTDCDPSVNVDFIENEFNVKKPF